jgi:hypothetical protein
MNYQIGDAVLYKGKKYYISSLMNHPDSNWSYSISLKNPLEEYVHYEEEKTIFKPDDLLLEPYIEPNEKQLSIFDFGVSI